jgi:Family of unknown function (DUF5993)
MILPILTSRDGNMAEIYILYLVTIFLILAKSRRLAIALILIGIILAASIFWYHVTDIIDIRL